MFREQEADPTKKVRLGRGFNWTFERIGYEKDDGLLAGAFAWDVVVKKGNTKLLSAQATYMVAYGDVPDVDEEPAFAFVERVGRFATYPYFRSHVAHMASQAGADVPVLPVLR